MSDRAGGKIGLGTVFVVVALVHFTDAPHELIAEQGKIARHQTWLGLCLPRAERYGIFEKGKRKIRRGGVRSWASASNALFAPGCPSLAALW